MQVGAPNGSGGERGESRTGPLDLMLAGAPGDRAKQFVQKLRVNIEAQIRSSTGAALAAVDRANEASGMAVAYLLGVPLLLLYRVGWLLLLLVLLGAVASSFMGEGSAEAVAAGFSALIILFVLQAFFVKPTFAFAASVAQSVLARRATRLRRRLGFAIEKGLVHAKNERDLLHGYLCLADLALDALEPASSAQHFRSDVRTLSGALLESHDLALPESSTNSMPLSRPALVAAIRWVCIGPGMISQRDRAAVEDLMKSGHLVLQGGRRGDSQWSLFTARNVAPNGPRANRTRVPSKMGGDNVAGLIFGCESPHQMVLSEYSVLESRLFATGFASMLKQVIAYRVRANADTGREQWEEMRRNIFETTSIVMDLPEQTDKRIDRLASYAAIGRPLLLKMTLPLRGAQDDSDRSADS